MARISGKRGGRGGLAVRVARFFGRRAMKQLTGRAPERALEPLELFAHAPGLLTAYARLEMAAGKLHGVDQRLLDLAQLKAATLTSCEYCIDLGSQIARRRSGLSDEQLLALPRYRESLLFTEREKLVLDYATGMSRTPVDVSDRLFDRLREQFDDAQLVQLTFVIALENFRGRFNLALGIGAAGFSEGMVCAVPVAAGGDGVRGDPVNSPPRSPVAGPAPPGSSPTGR
jgi:AhpD family alkylhydroperoxidase